MKSKKFNDLNETAFGFKIIEKPLGYFLLLYPYRWFLAFGFVLLVLTNIVILTLPRMINIGISIIENREPVKFDFLNTHIIFSNVGWVSFSILIVALLGALIRTQSRMVIFDIGRKIERDVRGKLFYHLTILGDNFFINHNVGELMNHLTQDVANTRLIFGFAILNIMNIFLMFFMTIPILFSIDHFLALFAIAPFPLVMIATSSITKNMFLRTKEYQRSLGNLMDHAQENFAGAYLVRLFRKQDYECDKFYEINTNNYLYAMKLARVRVLLLPIMRLVIGLAMGALVLAGGQAIFTGRISVGDFVEISTRILQLSWPAMSVGFVLSIYNRGNASMERINELLSFAPDILDGSIELKKVEQIDVVGLSISINSRTVLKDIGFSLSRGQILGIVGASGSSKTTLLKALSHRLIIPDGTIFFDGNDINNITLSSFYRNLSIVDQEPFLFHATIRENICFATNLDEAELLKIVDLVQFRKDLEVMPNGLDTIIGERGITLSGGQRQRVALARALASPQREILILDDVLSALDQETAKKIMDVITKRLFGITIIVSHRLSTVMNADEILVLENGVIAERGTHGELISFGKMYAKLWELNASFGL